MLLSPSSDVIQVVSLTLAGSIACGRSNSDVTVLLMSLGAQVKLVSGMFPYNLVHHQTLYRLFL